MAYGLDVPRRTNFQLLATNTTLFTIDIIILIVVVAALATLTFINVIIVGSCPESIIQVQMLFSATTDHIHFVNSIPFHIKLKLLYIQFDPTL